MLALTKKTLGRRAVLAGAAVAAVAAPRIGRAADAEFSYKFATGQAPTHPVNIRLGEALDRVRTRSNGRLDIRLFPANQLGTETDVMSQVRNGGIEFLLLSASILATLVPTAGIANTAFAFPDYDAVWKGMDGGLGTYTQAQIEKAGLVANNKIWNNGFRQITSTKRDIRGPADLAGFKIRVPPAPMLTSFFSDIGAAPTPMNFAEVYTALQTGVIDGQENALSLIQTTRLYEVQKFCALTSHSWDGYWPLTNRRAWEKLPDDLKSIFRAEMDQSVMQQRVDVTELDRNLRGDLTAKGMTFREIDPAEFRAAIAKTTYYKTWKDKYGEEAWSHLEAVAGRLA